MAENSSVERARETLRIVGSGARNRKIAIAVPTQPMAWPMGSSLMVNGEADRTALLAMEEEVCSELTTRAASPRPAVACGDT